MYTRENVLQRRINEIQMTLDNTIKYGRGTNSSVYEKEIEDLKKELEAVRSKK